MLCNSASASHILSMHCRLSASQSGRLSRASSLQGSRPSTPIRSLTAREGRALSSPHASAQAFLNTPSRPFTPLSQGGPAGPFSRPSTTPSPAPGALPAHRHSYIACTMMLWATKSQEKCERHSGVTVDQNAGYHFVPLWPCVFQVFGMMQWHMEAMLCSECKRLAQQSATSDCNSGAVSQCLLQMPA